MLIGLSLMLSEWLPIPEMICFGDELDWIDAVTNLLSCMMQVHMMDLTCIRENACI